MVRLTLWSVLVALAGCGPADRVALRVKPPALAHVPEPMRSHLGAKEALALAGSRAELVRAQNEIAPAAQAIADVGDEQQRAAAETAKRRAALDAATKGGEGPAIDQAKLDLVVAGEAEQVLAAKRVWQQAQLAWRERARDAADLRVAADDATLELVRAEAAAQRGAEIDLPPYRGQHARLHQAWSDGCARLAAAHAAADARQRELMQLKARYAQAHKVVLPKPAIPEAAPITVSAPNPPTAAAK